MACKRANFKTTFSIDKLTLAQADELYQKLLSLLSFDLKDRLAVEVQDCVGGKHDLFHETGMAPSGDVCKKCCRFDCADCPAWAILQSQKVSASNE